MLPYGTGMSRLSVSGVIVYTPDSNVILYTPPPIDGTFLILLANSVLGDGA